jgi:murein DD-endopeptidase MepM/ murein hydrolase activator NlpD
MRISFRGKYEITRRFGVVDSAYARYPGSKHPGTDYAVPDSTQLYAGMTGRVDVYRSMAQVGRGNEVWITNGNISRRVCHMNRVDVRNGQWVEEGGPIGLSGHTGYVLDYLGRIGTPEGAHVHDELLIDGEYVDLNEHVEGEDVIRTAKEVNLLWQLNGIDRAPTEKEVKEAIGRELEEYLAYLLKTEPVKDNLAKVKFYNTDVRTLASKVDELKASTDPKLLDLAKAIKNLVKE